MTSRAQALFELAVEIEDQLSDHSEALEKAKETIGRLTDLHPESFQWAHESPHFRL